MLSINGNIILNDDVEIRGLMSHSDKYDDINSYNESEYYKVIEPTKSIITQFKDSIFYALPAVTCYCLNNMRLEHWQLTPNLYKFNNYDSVVKHLTDESKVYFLVKLAEVSGIWNLYIYEKSNISNIRNKKIDDLLQ